MDHNEAVAQKATEKYLLNELDPTTRNQFEEHFFDCQECAKDVHSGALFIAQAKTVFAEPEVERVTPKPVPARWWKTLLSPAYASAFALLLLVGYQNILVLPQLSRRANTPVVLASTSINLSTYGSPEPIRTKPEQDFLVNVIVPPDKHYPSYRADLHNPAGAVELSLAIAASSSDTWPIRIPGTKRASGTYKIVVNGLTAEGKEEPVGSGSFELQVQN